jgi:hypothetical protein
MIDLGAEKINRGERPRHGHVASCRRARAASSLPTRFRDFVSGIGRGNPQFRGLREDVEPHGAHTGRRDDDGRGRQAGKSSCAPHMLNADGRAMTFSV